MRFKHANVYTLGGARTVPTYTYTCTACNDVVEKRQSFTDPPLRTCEQCGGTLRKIIHPVGIVFKGSGWYVTDSRSSKASSNGKETSGDSDSSASKDSSAKESSSKESSAKESSSSKESGSAKESSGSKDSSTSTSSSKSSGSPSDKT